ncbi:ATRX [Cordylochernes scorpioides]|uniref:ATRX n=1 Tax=Cordylochernes scorpioides TaxID=51811 RepID=A0ABY6JWZ3_9ARAC|nr:ATRX [Cordylochernes scorpioides]
MVSDHCMVQFVKPHLMGTRKEFQNRFVNPIMNGQCADSNDHDVHLMKKRAHILHSLLEGCVQRCDYSALRSFLPPKYEYVISIRLSETQIRMYRYFLDNFSRGGRKDSQGGTAGTALFWDFNVLRQIWNHPYTFHINEMKKMENEADDEENQKMKSFINDDSTSDSESEDSAAKDEVICLDGKSDDEKSKKKAPPPTCQSSCFLTQRSRHNENSSSSSDEEKITKWKSRSRSAKSGVEGLDEGASTSTAAPKDPPEPREYSRREWWLQYYNPENDHVAPSLSGKVLLLLDILKECEAIGDKVLLFSQSLLTLDLIEEVLRKVDEENEAKTDDLRDFIGSWVHGLDYFRMDGSTNVDYRKKWIQIFNDEDNMRSRLFMISTKSGSLGTNLIGANRVIIMDASWNPTHDVQAIFRVYRFGQKKPVYIYRFLAQGTMEEKIYDRQVTKQSLSYRVLDEHQIERHFNAADLAELYSFSPDTVSNRPTPMVPKDLLLADLLMKRKEWISTYHEHDSLLQNVVAEDLTEEERKLAWQEYEAEKEGLLHQSQSGIGGVNFGANVFGVTISQHPVSYDKIDKMPDAKADIAAIVESIKRNRPGVSQTDLNAALMSVLIIRRTHQQQCQTLSVQQKQAFLDKNEPVPAQLNAYLAALNVSIQQITHVIRSLNQQKNLLLYGTTHYPGYRQRNQTYVPPRSVFMNPHQPRPAYMNQFIGSHAHMNQLREQFSNAAQRPGGENKAYKVTLMKVPPTNRPIITEATSSTSRTSTTSIPESTVTITEID